MKRVGALIALILLAECSASAAPIKRAHKPWLMIGGEERRAELQQRREDPKPAPVRARRSSPSAAARPAPARPASQVQKTAERANVDQPGHKIAKQALKYKGTKYRFGGTSKKGLDCSGLVARIYEDLKMKRVPRASAALYKSGEPVKLNDLRPGDLVFFKNTYRRGISHVGIYAGHNKFVHASNERRGVTITPLSDPYYQLHYAGARRLY
jgi:cell wall-associated NlpC family hydrolase